MQIFGSPNLVCLFLFNLKHGFTRKCNSTSAADASVFVKSQKCKGCWQIVSTVVLFVDNKEVPALTSQSVCCEKRCGGWGVVRLSCGGVWGGTGGGACDSQEAGTKAY